MENIFNIGDIVKLNTNRKLHNYQKAFRYKVISVDNVLDVQLLDEETPHIYKKVSPTLFELYATSRDFNDPRIKTDEIKNS
jgi:hypothetical protein